MSRNGEAPAIALVAALVVACAANTDAPPVAAPGPTHSEVAAMQARIEALEVRVEELEDGVETQVKPTDRPPRSWSCMAKCGSQSSQTTRLLIEFEPVTGEGSTAAAAYEDLMSKCLDGRLYERLEDGRFLGGQMKSVCMRDAAPDGPEG